MAQQFKIITFSDSSFDLLISSSKEEVIRQFKRENPEKISHDGREMLIQQSMSSLGLPREEAESFVKNVLEKEIVELDKAIEEFSTIFENSINEIKAIYDKPTNTISISSPQLTISIQITPFGVTRLNEQKIFDSEIGSENHIRENMTRTFSAVIIARINNLINSANDFEKVEI